MKAKIVRRKGYIDYVHGEELTIKWLVVKEADNLAITFDDNKAYVFTGFNFKDGCKGCKVIGEVEVPDELVEKALAFARAKADLNVFKNSFFALLG